MPLLTNTNSLTDPRVKGTTTNSNTGYAKTPQPVTITSTPTERNVQQASSLLNSIDTAYSGSSKNLNDIGSTIRMVGNAPQGVTQGAAPPSKDVVRAVAAEKLATEANGGNTGDDWRVSLSVPTQISGGEVLKPLEGTNNKLIFPFNPQISLGHTANYATVHPTHTNYAFYAYQNSQVDAITISADFYNENADDAAYWIAAIHYLRSMTKMFYGNGENLGNPPLVARLNGYGKHVLNNIPVLITNFTVDLPKDVDYISTTVAGAEVNYAPVQSTITVQCTPNYARRSHSRFNLKGFANGEFVSKDEGFI